MKPGYCKVFYENFQYVGHASFIPYEVRDATPARVITYEVRDATLAKGRSVITMARLSKQEDGKESERDMKTLIIYTSQTGFTKRYAKWLADKTGGDLLDLKDARKKTDVFFEDYDAICYGGWLMAANIVKAKWFLEKAVNWKDKRLAVFCVGGSPNDNPDIDIFLQNALTEEQKKYIKIFYCQGGFNYEKMKAPARIAMKLFVSSLKNKKGATKEEKIMAETMASSYDISDIKYLEPVFSYLGDTDNKKAVGYLPTRG